MRRLIAVSVALTSSLLYFFLLKPPSRDARALATSLTQASRCSDFADEFWDVLYRRARLHTLPSTRDLTRALGNIAPGPDLAELYRIPAAPFAAGLFPHHYDADDAVGTFAHLELGDRRTPTWAARSEAIHALLLRLSQFVPKKTPCFAGSTSASFPEPPLFRHWRTQGSPLVFGARKVLATLYQSCEADSLPPVSANTAELEGVKITGTYPDGVGRKRIIDDLSRFNATHYYLAKRRLPGPGCFDVATHPSLYDYGGRPWTEPGRGSTFDFFRNSGGTLELGTDCSGFVYSALAAGGLKLKKEGRLKAISINGIVAAMFFHPRENGLDCFDYATFKANRSLRAGDILASKGHVVIVDKVGPDPFGVFGVRRRENCVPEKLSPSRFDFTILQSSPYKGGLGVQRSRARDYFSAPGEEDMTHALLLAAASACHARFEGASFPIAPSTAAIIRHSDSAECMDQPIHLTGEDCLDACRVRDRQNLR